MGSISLTNLKATPGANKKRKRVGRGHGSTGINAGRGNKGQKHRTGHHGARIGFEGGQMPMQRRLPKRGFTNIFRIESAVVNIGDVAAKFPKGGDVDVEALKTAGIVPRKAVRVKVLGEGDVGPALKISAHAFSAGAREKIEKAGGTVTVLSLLKVSAEGAEAAAK